MIWKRSNFPLLSTSLLFVNTVKTVECLTFGSQFMGVYNVSYVHLVAYWVHFIADFSYPMFHTHPPANMKLLLN